MRRIDLAPAREAAGRGCYRTRRARQRARPLRPRAGLPIRRLIRSCQCWLVKQTGQARSRPGLTCYFCGRSGGSRNSTPSRNELRSSEAVLIAEGNGGFQASSRRRRPPSAALPFKLSQRLGRKLSGRSLLGSRLASARPHSCKRSASARAVCSRCFVRLGW